ncbi:MAG: VOC family protein [Hyphomicrobiales bacterium]
MTEISAATVTPYLCAKGAAEAIEFYKKAFGAEETTRYVEDDGRVGHAELRIGASEIMLSDEYSEYRVLSPLTLGGNSVSLSISVPDVDAAFQRAIEAGAKVERPLKDEPYGRAGWLIDPFGHRWNLIRPAQAGS